MPRARRTNAQLAQLDDQIYDVLDADHPQSVRHVFYRMTDPRLPEPVEKTDNGYRHVQRRMTVMRIAGTLPYEWVTDTSRWAYHTDTYASGGEFLDRVAGLYRADLWVQSDTYIEVWVESRSLAGVLTADCRELAVSLYPAGGFASLSFTYEAARNINYAVTDDYGEEAVKAARILYIGDYDPAGVLIDKAVVEGLRPHLVDGLDFGIERLAINEAQIKQFDLPTKPRKAGDKRSQHILETVEAEAMPAAQMRALLRAEVEAYLPANALAVAKVAEDSERQTLLGMAKAWGDE